MTMMITTIDSGISAAPEDWMPSGQQTWTLQTDDGYVGRASWRQSGAAITVTRSDGTDLLRRTWGSREIFRDSWPQMFDWLKGQVTRQIAADRSSRADAGPPTAG
jgi:hypothetical protein